MTKNEILEKHLKRMLDIFYPNGITTLEDLKHGKPFMFALNAMEEYAQQEVNKNLHKPAVGGKLPPFYCPNCGNEWDTKKHNSCECGAVVSGN